MKKKIQRLLLLALLLGATRQLGFAQASYAVQYVSNGGYPGGIRTGGLSNYNLWFQLLPPNLTANRWSAARAIPFLFFGSPVTQFKVSANLLLMFDVAAT